MNFRKFLALLLTMPVLLGLSSCMLVLDMFDSDGDEITPVSLVPENFGNIDTEYREPYLAYVRSAESMLYRRDVKQYVQHISDAELEQADVLVNAEIVTVLGEESSGLYLIVQSQRNIIGYVAAANLERYDAETMYRVAYVPNSGVNQATLVDVSSLLPDAVFDSALAAKGSYLDYFMNPGQKKEDESALLSKSWILMDKASALKLAAAQRELSAQGYCLKFLNGYYPQKLQYELYRAIGNPALVPNPKDQSRNAQGIAVDVTLVDAQGGELDMPTEAFDYTNRAARYPHTGAAATARAHAAALTAAMESAGFTGEQWWHFYDAERNPMIMNQSMDGMILKMMVRDWTETSGSED